MEAIPVERAAAAAVEVAPLPDIVAPSQAAYARPGLPGERAPLTPRPVAPKREEDEEDVRLTPEQEVLAAFVEEDEEPVAAAPAAEAPVAPRRERESPTGLRFAEEIGDLRIEEEDADAVRRGAAAKRKARRPGPAQRVRAAGPQRGSGRRFEVDDEEIEAALKGDDFLDDDEGDDEDDY